jgi:molybdopterin/thiamine biosynthesis adenylyltransferase
MGVYDRQDNLGLNSGISLSIIGCGGIGFHVAKLSAMSGIKNIYAFDPDIVEDSNLNRLDIPERFIGMNKADVVYKVVKILRPECNIYPRPFVFQDINYTKTDWIVDCTDKFESQQRNRDIARKTNTRYCKSGYDGEQFSINNDIAEWGESQDGYTITPSWAVPTVIIAALTVAKIMKYNNSEVYSSIKEILNG